MHLVAGTRNSLRQLFVYTVTKNKDCALPEFLKRLRVTLIDYP